MRTAPLFGGKCGEEKSECYAKALSHGRRDVLRRCSSLYERCVCAGATYHRAKRAPKSTAITLNPWMNPKRKENGCLENPLRAIAESRKGHLGCRRHQIPPPAVAVCVRRACCLGKCVAWCSRPRWGGLRSLTLRPPEELSAWTCHLQVHRHAAGRPLLLIAGGGDAPHMTRGGLHSLTALARVVLLYTPASHGDGVGGWRGPGARQPLRCPGVNPGQRSGQRCNCPRKGGGAEGTPPE